jgi:hypothetical protein
MAEKMAEKTYQDVLWVNGQVCKNMAMHDCHLLARTDSPCVFRVLCKLGRNMGIDMEGERSALKSGFTIHAAPSFQPAYYTLQSYNAVRLCLR